jgi:RNA polymerase sigma-70 factor (ECF subfamily)
MRTRALLTEHYAFVWRQLRRLGLTNDQAEDAAQKVFFIASNRLDDIRVGSERAFLFGAARRVAAESRRKAGTIGDSSASVHDAADTAPLADELLDRRRARSVLDKVLDTMEEDVRVVFILFELEEVSIAEIAQIVGVPLGTVGSRLRRGRAAFHAAVKRFTARGDRPGATR